MCALSEERTCLTQTVLSYKNVSEHIYKKQCKDGRLFAQLLSPQTRTSRLAISVTVCFVLFIVNKYECDQLFNITIISEKELLFSF